MVLLSIGWPRCGAGAVLFSKCLLFCELLRNVGVSRCEALRQLKLSGGRGF